MERAQVQNSQPRNHNNNIRGNNTWQKKGQPSEQRPPNPLESTNLVDEAPPYCRACDALHEEVTCPIVKRIMNSGMFGASKQINVVGKEFSLSMEDWMEVKENSQDVRPFTSSHSINILIMRRI